MEISGSRLISTFNPNTGTSSYIALDLETAIETAMPQRRPFRSSFRLPSSSVPSRTISTTLKCLEYIFPCTDGNPEISFLRPKTCDISRLCEQSCRFRFRDVRRKKEENNGFGVVAVAYVTWALGQHYVLSCSRIRRRGSWEKCIVGCLT